MTVKLDQFLDAVELHRQRDDLEAALRGIVAVLDSVNTDPLAQVKLLATWGAAKLLLASLDQDRLTKSSSQPINEEETD